MMKENDIALLIISILLTLSCSKKSFNSEIDFLNYYENKGYYCIGLYSDGWPAKIVPEKIHNNEVVMSFNSNGIIRYEGFEDMDLKIVVMKDINDKKGVAAFFHKKYSFLHDTIIDKNTISYNQLLKMDINKVELINGDDDTLINLPLEYFNYLIRHVYGAKQEKTDKIKGALCTGTHEYVINDTYRIKTSCELIYQPTNDLFQLKGHNYQITYDMLFEPDIIFIESK